VTVSQIEDLVIGKAEPSMDCDPLNPRFEIGRLLFSVGGKYVALILESSEVPQVALRDKPIYECWTEFVKLQLNDFLLHCKPPCRRIRRARWLDTTKLEFPI
jgi:hypothetical protein